MYSDNTIWLRVEEVVRKNDQFEVGFRDEMSQKCKFVRLMCSDKQFRREDVYVIQVNALRRHRVNHGNGNETEYFIAKDDIDMILIDEFKNYTSIMDVKSEKLCDEHRGVPRLEYV